MEKKMSLESTLVEYGGKKYVVYEYSYSDFELAQAYLTKNKITDPIEAAFVMLARCVKTPGGKAVFKNADYKKAKTDYSMQLLNKLSNAMNDMNNWNGAVEAIEKNS